MMSTSISRPGAWLGCSDFDGLSRETRFRLPKPGYFISGEWRALGDFLDCANEPGHTSPPPARLLLFGFPARLSGLWAPFSVGAAPDLAASGSLITFSHGSLFPPRLIMPLRASSCQAASHQHTNRTIWHTLAVAYPEKHGSDEQRLLFLVRLACLLLIFYSYDRIFSTMAATAR